VAWHAARFGAEGRGRVCGTEGKRIVVRARAERQHARRGDPGQPSADSDGLTDSYAARVPA